MDIDLTPIFQAVIALLAALVTYKLIPWIKSRTTQQQQDNLAAAAKIAVYAAEQLYGANKGAEKLEYARQVLLAAGYDMDTDALRAAIESAVYNLPIWNNVFPKDEPKEEDIPFVDEAHPPEE